MTSASYQGAQPVFKFEYRNWYYFFTPDGIVSFNVLTKKIFFSYWAGYCLLLITLLILGIKVSIIYGELWAIVIISGIPALRILEKIERTRNRDLLFSELSQTSRSNSFTNWSDVNRIDLCSNKIRIKLGKGFNHRTANLKIISSEYPRIKSFLVDKISDRLVLK